jgi:two-component system, HptB-dependent secretion and biofilm response regulator
MTNSPKTKYEATILVCDDDEIILGLISQTLQKKGYLVIETEDGAEALQAFGENSPDLVIMDAKMPEMDGFQVCRKLRKTHEGRDTPIIMITALEDDNSVNQAFEAGAVEYVTKPIQWAVLLQRIKLQIKAHQAFDEVNKQRDRLTFERELIENIITRIRQSEEFDPKGIRFLIDPVEKTAGDMLLSACSPNGTQHIFLGDVTGHGLPAAIIGPTVSDIFYSMTRKGFSSGVILSEINRKLNITEVSAFFWKRKQERNLSQPQPISKLF